MVVLDFGGIKDGYGSDTTRTVHVGEPSDEELEVFEIVRTAQQAGFDDITPTGGLWCFATPETRDWWGGMWADRIVESALARQLVDTTMATAAELDEIAAAWRDWAAAPDGWIGIPHGEILCRV